MQGLVWLGRDGLMLDWGWDYESAKLITTHLSSSDLAAFVTQLLLTVHPHLHLHQTSYKQAVLGPSWPGRFITSHLEAQDENV